MLKNDDIVKLIPADFTKYEQTMCPNIMNECSVATRLSHNKA